MIHRSCRPVQGNAVDGTPRGRPVWCRRFRHRVDVQETDLMSFAQNGTKPPTHDIQAALAGLRVIADHRQRVSRRRVATRRDVRFEARSFSRSPVQRTAGHIEAERLCDPTTIAPKMAICSQPLPIIETSCRPSRHTAEAASPRRFRSIPTQRGPGRGTTLAAGRGGVAGRGFIRALSFPAWAEGC